MKLFFWDDPAFPRNFGDQLNLWLWLQLLPGVMDENSNEIFVGVGSILNTRIPTGDRIVVMGSGIGYASLPTVTDRWEIYAVRGPRTAAALNLSPDTAVVDPGILVNRIFGRNRVERSGRPAFIPHWRSRSRHWSSICRRIGVDYIDPLSAVPDIVGQIRSARFLIAEAMHGAIAADAFRVPWVPLWSDENVDSFRLKWEDWCASVDLEYEPRHLPESPAVTAEQPWKRVALTIGRRAYPYAHRRKIKRIEDYMDQIVRTPSPVLSSDSTLKDRTELLLDRIDRFRRTVP